MTENSEHEVKREPIVGGQEPGRNELCPCGSGLKYKQCHGDAEKLKAVRMFSQAFMQNLVHHERMKKGLEPWPYQCQACGEGFIRPKIRTQTILTKILAPGEVDRPSEVLCCPKCDSTDIARNTKPAASPASQEVPTEEIIQNVTNKTGE